MSRKPPTRTKEKLPLEETLRLHWYYMVPIMIWPVVYHIISIFWPDSSAAFIVFLLFYPAAFYSFFPLWFFRARILYFVTVVFIFLGMNLVYALLFWLMYWLLGTEPPFAQLSS